MFNRDEIFAPRYGNETRCRHLVTTKWEEEINFTAGDSVTLCSFVFYCDEVLLSDRLRKQPCQSKIPSLISHQCDDLNCCNIHLLVSNFNISKEFRKEAPLLCYTRIHLYFSTDLYWQICVISVSFLCQFCCALCRTMDKVQGGICLLYVSR